MTGTNVFRLSHPGSFTDSLTEVLRNGACALLAQAVEAEVAALLSCHADKLTADGRQRLVRHGHLPGAFPDQPGAAHGDRTDAGHDLALGGSSIGEHRTAESPRKGG